MIFILSLFCRYEEEVRLAEMERGIDVEFINPTPNCVLKSRSWPSLAQEAMNQTDLIDRSKVNAPSTIEGQKIFINICSCDKLEEPTLVPGKNGDKPLWNIPHCFAPPVEDFDKEHKRCVVGCSFCGFSGMFFVNIMIKLSQVYGFFLLYQNQC